MRSVLTSIRCACETTVLYAIAFDFRISLRNASLSGASLVEAGADGGWAVGAGRGAVAGAAGAGCGLERGGTAALRGGTGAEGAARRGAATGAGRGNAPPDPAD